MRALFLLLLLSGFVGVAEAQPSGCPFNASSCQVKPTGAASSSTAATLAAQGGVLLDSFFVTGDADYSAALARAVTAGVAIQLGPKTYTVNNFTMAGTPATFTLRGVPGKSIIQRTSASASSHQFKITATNVYISGVTFDMNKAVVTADQWGVFLGQGGQNVTIRDSVFKNNSGALGDGLILIQGTGSPAGGEFLIEGNEFTGNAGIGLLLGSVQDGVVTNNYVHDNTGNGISAGSWLTATATNHLQNVLLVDNRVLRNSTGITIGGYAPPYAMTTPGAIEVRMERNLFEDNAVYAAGVQGQRVAVVDNTVRQSDPSVIPVFGGIFVTSQKALVAGNMVTFAGVNWGIDCGGSTDVLATGNVITMTKGSALNAGGNVDSQFSNNKMILSGTATGVSIIATEADGNFSPMPNLSSNIIVKDNIMVITAVGANGIQLRDNAGGLIGAKPIIITGNRFETSGASTGPANDIQYYGSAASVYIDGNLHNGSNVGFVDPDGNGDISFENVYFGGSISGVSANVAVRSFATTYYNTYNAGGSILYVSPLVAGSGYTAATTLAASGTGGGSGWTGTPLIIAGAIIGIRTNTFGSGYSGTITVAATDSGGGTGATFTVGNLPRHPAFANISFITNIASQFMQKSGGTIAINAAAGYYLSNVGGNSIGLQASSGGGSWNVKRFTLPSIAIGSLPTCGATQNGSQVNVSGSVSGKWQARCNATNWIAPDGTTIN